MLTRRAAKQNAAFQACIALHRAGALNDHLLPLRASRSDDAQEDVDGSALDRRPLPSNFEVQLVNPFGNVFASSTAHVYVFQLSTQPPSRIAMVCGADVEVPPHNLYGSDGGSFELRLLAHDRLDWPNSAERDERLSALESFNKRLSRVVLNRRLETIGSMLSGLPSTKQATLTGNSSRIRSRKRTSRLWRWDRW